MSPSAASLPPFKTPDSLLSCFSKCNEWERVEQRGRPWDEFQGQVSLPPRNICFPHLHIPLRPLPEACGPPRPCPQGGERGRPLLQLPEVDPALQSTELGAQAPQSSCPGLGEDRGGGEKQRGAWAGKSGRLGRKGCEGGWCFAAGSCLRPSQGRLGSRGRRVPVPTPVPAWPLQGHPAHP